MFSKFILIGCIIAFSLQIIKVKSDDLISVSQISPKSDKLDENNILYQSQSPSTAPLQTIISISEEFKSSSAQLNDSATGESQINGYNNNVEEDDNNNNNLADTSFELNAESESDEEQFNNNNKGKRVERSASPILHNNEIPSNINLVDGSAQNHIDPVNKKIDDQSGRYFSLIQPTSTIGNTFDDTDDSLSDGMTANSENREDEEDFMEQSFLSKRGPRLIPSGSPSSRQIFLSETTSTASIKPSSVTQTVSPTATEDVTDLARQNSNPDIQDIITGIVKLLNGNVNVHANTQPFAPPSRRPYATRINNRGPPRISDAQPLPQENIYEQAPGSTIRPQPPYPFDRPDGPIRPFLTGVPLPEQIVPSSNNNNYRPSFISQTQQGRPPWQRPRPRPPIQTNGNRRPILTPPPYKFGTRPTPTEQSLLEEESIPTTSSASDSVELDRPINTTLTYEVTEPLETEEFVLETNQTNPSKEELSKKKDKFKKPSISSNLNQKIDATKTMNPSSMIMKTIIQTTSEIHTSQHIPSSEILSTPTFVESSLIEPSDDFNSYKIATDDTTVSSTTETPPLTTSTSSVTSVENNYSRLPVIEPVKSSSISSQLESQSSAPIIPPSFHPRPGIVLDDPEFKPGGHARPQSKYFDKIQPSRSVQTQHAPQSTLPPGLPPGYGEIFDVTLSAIQGPGTGKDQVQTINIKPYGVGGGDIIVSASGDDSFVSIDGKRTYINLFGEQTAPPNQIDFDKKPATSLPAKPQAIQPTKSVTAPIIGTGFAVVDDSSTKQPYASSHATVQKQQLPHSHTTRPNYRVRPQQPPVRIDTCIVGDDSTCDLAQNERCKTDAGVSSCHCRPGFARRKHREPCRKIVSLLMSLRVDKFYERRIAWDKLLANPNSEPYAQLSYEAVRAIDSAMSMTPFSDEFLDARVNKIYNGDASQGAAGVFVNLTIQLEENGETLRPNVKSEIQKHLLGVIHRRNNNIGNSVLYVESPAGSISNLQDLDECSSSDLNDCHPEATCTNVWGSFHCKCQPGFRDPWSDTPQRAGRECLTCSDSYCNSRGTCSYDATGTQQICECLSSYYGNQCEIDGEVLAVAIGASVIAVVIIVLTLICLVMWSRRWHREQKDAMGSPVFGYMAAASAGMTGTQLKAGQTPYQVSLEDRMRWAQIADVMAQSNHYAAEPVAPRPQSALYGYPNLQMMNQMNTLSVSMAGTLPMHHHHPGSTLPPIPLPRLNLHGRGNGMRALESSSSSEEEDRADLLGRNFQVPRPKSRSNGSIANQSGIYYDVDYEPSGGELYGGTTTTTTTSCNNISNNASGAHGMSKFTSRGPQSYYMK